MGGTYTAFQRASASYTDAGNVVHNMMDPKATADGPNSYVFSKEDSTTYVKFITFYPWSSQASGRMILNGGQYFNQISGQRENGDLVNGDMSQGDLSYVYDGTAKPTHLKVDNVCIFMDDSSVKFLSVFIPLDENGAFTISDGNPDSTGFPPIDVTAKPLPSDGSGDGGIGGVGGSGGCFLNDISMKP